MPCAQGAWGKRDTALTPWPGKRGQFPILSPWIVVVLTLPWCLTLRGPLLCLELPPFPLTGALE